MTLSKLFTQFNRVKPPDRASLRWTSKEFIQFCQENQKCTALHLTTKENNGTAKRPNQISIQTRLWEMSF